MKPQPGWTFWTGWLCCFAFVALLGADTKKGDDRPTKPKALFVEEADTDLSGIYYCEGKYAKGSYDGCVLIRRVKGVYFVQWMAGSTARGVGIRVDNRLSVGWQDKDAGVVGSTLYEVKGKTLAGKWSSMPGSEARVWDETLTLIKALAPE